jgi:hemerythrin-like domain-containing protein
MTAVTPVSISLHAGPAVGFEQPFEMLHACHERVQRMLGLLGRLAEHLATSGHDESAALAARDVMRYFDRAAVAHHEDEELHVLPRLRAQGLAAVAERLHADHRRMAAGWAGVRLDLRRLAAEPAARLAPAEGHAQRWADFAALYHDHIEVEETVAYPAVQPHCAPADIVSMGREMSARRGVPPG